MEEKEENPGVKGTITKHFIAKSSDKKLHNLSILDGAGARCSLMQIFQIGSSYFKSPLDRFYLLHFKKNQAGTDIFGYLVNRN